MADNGAAHSGCLGEEVRVGVAMAAVAEQKLLSPGRLGSRFLRGPWIPVKPLEKVPEFFLITVKFHQTLFY